MSKIYFRYRSDPEDIAVENLTFDKHKRFFANDNSLTSYFIYVMGIEPSTNNVKHSKVSQSSFYSAYPQAADVMFDIQYDSEGNVKYYDDSISGTTDQEYYFYNAGYDCK